MKRRLKVWLFKLIGLDVLISNFEARIEELESQAQDAEVSIQAALIGVDRLEDYPGCRGCGCGYG